MFRVRSTVHTVHLRQWCSKRRMLNSRYPIKVKQNSIENNCSCRRAGTFKQFVFVSKKKHSIKWMFSNAALETHYYDVYAIIRTSDTEMIGQHFTRAQSHQDYSISTIQIHRHSRVWHWFLVLVSMILSLHCKHRRCLLNYYFDSMHSTCQFTPNTCTRQSTIRTSTNRAHKWCKWCCMRNAYCICVAYPVISTVK